MEIRAQILEQRVSKKIEENREIVAQELGHGVSFDIIIRDLQFGGRKAFLLGVDGFIKDDVLLRIVQGLYQARREDLTPKALDKIVEAYLGYIETNVVETIDEVIDQVLAGPVALFVDGEESAIIIDSRTYPSRGPQEPDLERVLRGPRDGFVETLVVNTALVRRRVRDPGLRVELLNIGVRSKADVALMYIDDIADPSLVKKVRDKLESIKVDAIPMAEKAIGEFLTDRHKRLNPFPTIRFTERPDVVAVHLLEGHLAVVVDTSPSVILLPTTIFHHIQHAEEFHQDHLVGNYLRWVRILGLLISWAGPPLWVALVLQKQFLPESLQFLGPSKSTPVPLFLQFVFAEVGVDLIRLGLIHTPTSLATSLGIIGAVLLGQLAVEVGLFTSEAVLYVTLAALGTFVTPSMELGQAVRLLRLVLLVLAGIFKLPGVVFGIVASMLLVGFTRSFGVPYLWPLIPLNPVALLQVLFRQALPQKSLRPSFLHPQDPDRR